MSEVIRLNKINKIYDSSENSVHALVDIDLSIEQGEYVAIMGASGSGKSTLMNVLGCLDKPTGGSYILDGRDVSVLTDDELSLVRNREIGFVFQSYNLINQNNALQNVQLPLLYAGETNSKLRDRRAKELLEAVGLAERIYHYPQEMSGGQRQRVAIARAMVNEPHIILADEPTGNLDSKASIEIMELFTKLNSEKNVTVILVTHERDIAEFTNRIITFRDGHIIGDERLTHSSSESGEGVCR